MVCLPGQELEKENTSSTFYLNGDTYRDKGYLLPADVVRQASTAKFYAGSIRDMGPGDPELVWGTSAIKSAPFANLTLSRADLGQDRNDVEPLYPKISQVMAEPDDTDIVLHLNAKYLEALGKIAAKTGSDNFANMITLRIPQHRQRHGENPNGETYASITSPIGATWETSEGTAYALIMPLRDKNPGGMSQAEKIKALIREKKTAESPPAECLGQPEETSVTKPVHAMHTADGEFKVERIG